MKSIQIPLFAIILIMVSCGENEQKKAMNDNLTNNPFIEESTLPFYAPDFTVIKNKHFKPAILEGMRQQSEAISEIVSSEEPATFENTILALETSGEMLDRVNFVFDALTSANTNDTLKAVQVEIAPLAAKHSDEIYLNKGLFVKVKEIYQTKDSLDLDPESITLIENYYKKFIEKGANLSEEDKDKLKSINEQLATLSNDFNQKILAATAAAAIEITDINELKGLSESQINNIKHPTKENTWVLTVTNTTQQGQLQDLENREVRQKLFEAGWNRAKEAEFDTQPLVLKMVKLRAEKAKLLGFDNYASWSLQNSMAQNPDNVLDLFSKLVPAATVKANKEAADIQAMINKEGESFDLEPWDWNYYAEKVRKEKYDLDENQIKPYFEMTSVLENGVFYAANKLFGITFKKRTDIPVYQDDVVTYELFNEDGSSIGLFYADYYARPSKSGGAWMSNFVNQSELYNKKPVIYNVMNIAKPAEGEKTYLSYDEVETMFHEFGHALHGFFADQKYPSLSGTAVARDFVEFPSQSNENWALHPEILPNYAIDSEGNTIPTALIEKIKAASTFNQGYSLIEVLAASNLDMLWHTVPVDEEITDVSEFEQNALESVDLYFEAIPSRYSSSYFSHIFSGGYSAGYYSYLWTEVLSHDAYQYIVENGGLTRENGQRYRDMVLSRGNTIELEKMYKDYRGSDPKIEPMIEARGLK